jgi:hypothetical protein
MRRMTVFVLRIVNTFQNDTKGLETETKAPTSGYTSLESKVIRGELVTSG